MSEPSRDLELATIRIGSDVDLAFTVAALEALEVPYHVRNEHFGAMRVGPRIAHFNERWLEIPREHLAAVGEALAARPGRDRLGPRRWNATTRLRTLIELLLFGWFVPGHAARVRPLRAAGLALGSMVLLALVAAALVGLLSVIAWCVGGPVGGPVGGQLT
jgi:hypothetical protein